ncbi:MAG TPA: hypothetical protein VK612_03285 [Pyrinomonadaceae bacterium]|nr:hypothetical protein [Pyrinomonadaceae bacterium]
MRLNTHTRKIIKRIAIADAIVGMLVLTIGIYIYDPSFLICGAILFVAAFIAFGIGDAIYD